MTGSDIEIADALDDLARAASRLRRIIPHMSLIQLAIVAACGPWDDAALDTLVEVDTWAVVAAASLRDGDSVSLSA